MARGRAQLPEKLERIMVQATLTGLTTADMIKIANRMRALDEERRQRADIDETIAGYTWTAIKSGWRIVGTEGHVFDCIRSVKRRREQWRGLETVWTITVTKPGTRYKTREIKDRSLRIGHDWKKHMMPETSKDLYALIRFIGGTNWSQE